ncbi:MAG TPA: mechanosensitive ion channel domain-containing protein [Gammaproteobacteria bacterium]|nr:mechanosensitive ion channel domain-containing protein [Gammaproteobacteria bacterium]
MHNSLDYISVGPGWLDSLVLLVGAAIVGWLFYWVLFAIICRFTGGRFASVAGAVVHNFRAPSRWLFPLFGVLLTLPALPLRHKVSGPIHHAIEIVLIATAGWLAVRLIDAAGDVLSARYSVDVPDNLHARKIRTQFVVLRRVGAVLIAAFALGLMLMTFPHIRALGTTLFASAGAAGIVVGLAARPVLTNLLAGIQIALTQPIRVEDSVIVEGEWGWIEEITTTYVVVRIWDLRRLVVPLTYFIENPFQNWTRKSTNLLGTAYIYADYSVPVQAVRDELHRILEASELWDGNAWSLDVTNLTEHAVEMRAMVSAANSGNTVNLRRLVREKLITFLQQNYPDSLPRTRVEVERRDENAAPSA